MAAEAEEDVLVEKEGVSKAGTYQVIVKVCLLHFILGLSPSAARHALLTGSRSLHLSPCTRLGVFSALSRFLSPLLSFPLCCVAAQPHFS